jgi:hypothetical protein
MPTAWFAVAWTIAFLLAAVLPALGLPKRSAPAFPAVGLILLVVLHDVPAGYRLLASSLLFLYLMKAAVLVAGRETKFNLAYATIWPGMDAENLNRSQECPAGEGLKFARSLTLTIVGLGSIAAIALFYPQIGPFTAGWLGIAAILCTLHFGVSGILTSLLRLSGRPVNPLFDRPFASRTLSEFWTKRWNLAFVEMDRRLFLPGLIRILGLRRAVFGVFLISGLLHEMAISYPAGAGWGGPLAYFALQCLGLAIERKHKIKSRPWTLLWVLAPLPLLFHTPFREVLVAPAFAWLHGVLFQWPLVNYLHAVLWSLPIMQLSVLMASYQVPKRLNWHEDLAQLTPFNRKLMWTYAIFIVTSVITFALLTLALHDSFIQGERAAAGLAFFMASFWILRLVFDTFYYKSEDWPEGEIFMFGHALLNALFVYLALGYGLAGVWAATR